MDAKRGDWVRIHSLILKAGERAGGVPEDTQKVPLEMWDKGFLLDDYGNIGDKVKVETYIGRVIEGNLIEVNPYYKHDFGKAVPELLYIGRQARALLKGTVNNND